MTSTGAAAQAWNQGLAPQGGAPLQTPNAGASGKKSDTTSPQTAEQRQQQQAAKLKQSRQQARSVSGRKIPGGGLLRKGIGGIKGAIARRLLAGKEKWMSKLGHVIRLILTFLILLSIITVIPFLFWGAGMLIAYWQISISLGRLDGKPFTKTFFHTAFFPFNLLEDARVVIYGTRYKDREEKKQRREQQAQQQQQAAQSQQQTQAT